MASHSFAALPVDMLADAIARLSRDEIEALTEHLIDRLDTLDGDPDLEDDDPAGGNPEDVGEHDYSRGLPRPIFGVDQTRLPLNAKKVWERWWFNEHAGVAEIRPGLRP
ncbi:hypothetical protein [Novosphingobium olei]|uniref:Uncharacterized protein n=1 Tax=Novosphingobium olei TaxID=2728851 RepID=A0A7Y0BRS5_9SPHN|nr:hypothetical protein [Novosphingobium olei]NML94726.1 hypothetical protein [Novosphingobium olei]